ncbi:MAG TPA: C39 family peptidase [Candidatus Dormibacteraeota bacterium]|nr:C39 family peptidase [Candidatus Dormibacteraeota bacterium]
MEVELRRGGGIRAADRRWRAIAIAVIAAVMLGGASAAFGRHFLDVTAARALPGITDVRAQPIPPVGPGTEVSPAVLPDHLLLQVPFTTQAPLDNWAQHQESCEAANLTMLSLYWQHDQSVVIDPHAADDLIRQIDGWKSQPDLNDTMMGQLAQQHLGYTYSLLPNDPGVIAQQLAAGRPLLAEVRTHGLGNPHYPGYSSHFEQAGWSVPHFVTIIGYDNTGVWLNDPGISWGRGYHITYAQLTHAIDDLDQHHPALSEGQVLLLVAPEATPKVRAGSF